MHHLSIFFFFLKDASLAGVLLGKEINTTASFGFHKLIGNCSRWKALICLVWNWLMVKPDHVPELQWQYFSSTNKILSILIEVCLETE